MFNPQHFSGHNWLNGKLLFTIVTFTIANNATFEQFFYNFIFSGWRKFSVHCCSLAVLLVVQRKAIKKSEKDFSFYWLRRYCYDVIVFFCVPACASALCLTFPMERNMDRHTYNDNVYQLSQDEKKLFKVEKMYNFFFLDVTRTEKILWGKMITWKSCRKHKNHKIDDVDQQKNLFFFMPLTHSYFLVISFFLFSLLLCVAVLFGCGHFFLFPLFAFFMLFCSGCFNIILIMQSFQFSGKIREVFECI